MDELASPARRAAVQVLFRTRRFDAWTAQTLRSVGDKMSLSEKDRALCGRLCRSVLQNAAYCDFLMAPFLRGKKIEPVLRDILRLGVCQLFFFDKIPARAVVNESVLLAKEFLPKTAGLVNAVLRKAGEMKNNPPAIPDAGTSKELSIRYSFPEWMCERLVQRHGYSFARDYLAACNSEPPLRITENPLRTGRPIRNMEMMREGAVEDFPGFDEGVFFVQDLAPYLSVQAADPQPGQRVLDACAAPGGKSFAAAMRMNNLGSVYSCDINGKKLSFIDEGAARLGLDIIETLPMDASKPYERFNNSFDLVMADVPCSGFGVIRRRPEIRYKKEEDIARLPEIQLSILKGLSDCVRPGGVLHYSTCTVWEEENHAVIQAFLAQDSRFSLAEERSFWPHLDGTDGFYYCKMIRHD